MRVEEIAVRQEVRQMLNEAGINQNTLKQMVKDVLAENVEKATKQAFHEKDIDGVISKKIENCTNNAAATIVRDEIRKKVNDIFHRMTVEVRIIDSHGEHVTVQ